DDDDDDDDDSGSGSKSSGNLTINEDVIYDDNDVKVTVSDVSYDDWYGTQIEFLIENGTDEDLNFNANYVFINGCVSNTYLSEGSVSAGKKTYAKLSLREDELEDFYNIKSIGNIQFELYATNDDWDYIVDHEVITLTTNLKADEPSFDEDVVLYDADGVYIAARFSPSEGDYGFNQIYVYCENHTDNEYSFGVDTLDINGFTIGGWLYVTLPGNTVGVGTIGIYDSDLEDNHIDEIEEIQLAVSVQNYDDWQDKFVTETVDIPV
ncbi:MAG: hypothetical protein J6U23_14170, partial [Clostridiales bacterium]|nr:hypothetical protein [Clostridiales bacterium]